MKTAVAVIESGVEEQNALAAQNAGGIVRTIAQQIEAVRGAELRSTFEKIKLGAMVRQAVTLLGLDSRGGNGSKGEGVRGWWESNFKGPDGQPMIPYQTLMRWIAAAEKLPRLLASEVEKRGGGGERTAPSPEKIMALLAKDPEQVIAKSERKVLDSAEKVANGMTLRQMLLWGDDAEPKRPGRPVGSGKSGEGEYKRKSTLECAVETVWPTVEYMLKHRGAMFTSYKLLPDEKLTEMRDTLEEHVKAITAVIEMREKDVRKLAVELDNRR